jgi:hypothetical protein
MMENVNVPRSKTLTPPGTSNRLTNKRIFDASLGRDRYHSWPFIPFNEEAEASSNAVYCARLLWNSPIRKTAAASCPPNAHAIHQGSYLPETSTEFPGSPDVFPEAADSPTLVSAEAPNPLLLRPRTQLFLRQAPESPRLASKSHLSAPVTNAAPSLRHRAGSEDLKRYFTLKEALEMLHNEACDSYTGYMVETSTDRINPSIEKTPRREVITETDVVGRDQLSNCFYSEKPYDGPNLPKTQLRGESNAKRFTRKLTTKLSRPLTRLSFRSKESSASPAEQVRPFKISHPFDLQTLRARAAESQYAAQSSESSLLNMLLPQQNHLKPDTYQAGPAIFRRLSITHTFGPTLAKSIEDAISKLESLELDPLAVPSQSPRANSCSLSAGIREPCPSTDPTTQSVRFQQPRKRRCRSSLRIQIPPSPPYLSPAYSHNRSRPPSSPTQGSSPSSEQRPETNLSLRGGCLPISRTRNPPPRRRIDPSHRPADDILVPPALLYLAGGRPVLRDKPGRPCYHGQPKPKRRFKNKRGLDEVDGSHQRVPNADPCEPLTFGHLRAWKQKSRPANRLNPQTGQMERVYRPFWSEFAYDVSRGKVGTMRPKRQQGAGGAYYGQGHGMAGNQGEHMYGGRGMDMGADTRRGEPDFGMGMGNDAGRSEPDYEMSGGLGADDRDRHPGDPGDGHTG